MVQIGTHVAAMKFENKGKDKDENVWANMKAKLSVADYVGI